MHLGSGRSGVVEEVPAPERGCRGSPGSAGQPEASSDGESLEAVTGDEPTPDIDLDLDPLFDSAVALARLMGSVSTSMLQMKLKIGFSRALRLMNELEAAGVTAERAQIAAESQVRFASPKRARDPIPAQLRFRVLQRDGFRCLLRAKHP